MSVLFLARAMANLRSKLIDASAPKDASMWDRLTEYGRGHVNMALDRESKKYGCSRAELVWRIDKDGVIHVKKRLAVLSDKKKKKRRETLSSLIPELALYDNQPKRTSMCTIVTQAWTAAHYAVENNFTSQQKEKLKSLFLAKYDLATGDMRDFLNGLSNLTHDDRKHWHRELTCLYERTKDLLWESLEKNAANNDRFVELLREDIRIWGGIGFDTESWQHGVIDPATRELVTEKPAVTNRGKEGPMSKPLSSAKWAVIFGVSRSTMRRWRKDKKYPFFQVSDRKWSLPIQKLPGEYLQKYQQYTKPEKS